MLSALAVRSGDVLSAEQLADALWGDDLPASWQKVVQGRGSGFAGSSGRAAVQTTSGGYRLTLADDEIDLRRFEHLLGRARELAGRASTTGRRPADAGAGAVARKPAGRRGRVAGGAHRGGPAGGAAAVRAGDRCSSSGRRSVRTWSPTRRALVAAQPLREARWHLLAVALYRAGRQSDALAALRGARRTLQDELGLDPGQELVELERAILITTPTWPPRRARCGTPGCARTRGSWSTTGGRGPVLRPRRGDGGLPADPARLFVSGGGRAVWVRQVLAGAGRRRSPGERSGGKVA